MSAVISKDGLYRYVLGRKWGPGPSYKTLMFCMLNPSTADAEVDDPTIRRCIGFAKREGYTGLVVVNVFAYRATDPKALKGIADPHGPENETHIFEAINYTQGKVVCAWGSNIEPAMTRSVTKKLWGWGAETLCLGVTKNGSPRHPLYVKADQPLLQFPLKEQPHAD